MDDIPKNIGRSKEFGSINENVVEMWLKHQNDVVRVSRNRVVIG